MLVTSPSSALLDLAQNSTVDVSPHESWSSIDCKEFDNELFSLESDASRLCRRRVAARICSASCNWSRFIRDSSAAVSAMSWTKHVTFKFVIKAALHYPHAYLQRPFVAAVRDEERQRRLQRVNVHRLESIDARHAR
jgi:hypothetical protein